MEALPVVLVALLALYMLPIAFGLDCYSCSNKPEIYGGTKCESGKAENITCDPSLHNRCMTWNYTMSIGPLGSTTIEIRNCSNSLACDPDSQWNTCKLVNMSGILTDCSLDCCQGDLCNKISDTTPKPDPASLECYSCSNKPDVFGGTKCESGKAEKITCDPLFYNRCMTTKYTASLGGLLGSMSIELKNCTNSFACDPHSQWNTCKMFNLTGKLTDCSLDCCQGDLCNKVSDTTPKPEPASLECYACSNLPEFHGGTKCESGKAKKITCDPLLYNRCMTVNYTTTINGPMGPMSVELRNCSSSFACDPDSQWNTCKMFNLTGDLTDCSFDCCEGDLCNEVSNTASKPEPAGLECYACSNLPELFGGTKCESGKAEKITCDPLFDNRCMTLKYTGFRGQSGLKSVELRKCTDSESCDVDSEFFHCNSGNSTPWFTECSVDCCEGNLCNKIPEPVTKPQDRPTSKAFELVASFGAILFVFALNMFA